MRELEWNCLFKDKLEQEKEYIIATVQEYTTVATWYKDDNIFSNEFGDLWELSEVLYVMEFPTHPDLLMKDKF